MKDEMTLERRLARARELRARGLNCAQTVAAVFDDIEGAPSAEFLTRFAGPLGGGVSGQGMICGALTTELMISAIADPADTPKPAVYALGRERSEEFERRFGSMICRELKQSLKVPCNEIIFDTIACIHARLHEARG